MMGEIAPNQFIKLSKSCQAEPFGSAQDKLRRSRQPIWYLLPFDSAQGDTLK